MMRAALISLALASPASAESHLRPTPDYFAATVFDITMAQALAQACGAVSVDPVRAALRSEEMLAALQADGFSLSAPHEEMQDPNAAIRGLQDAFVARYALENPGEERVCEISRSEMAEGTGIGLLLQEVAE